MQLKAVPLVVGASVLALASFVFAQEAVPPAAAPQTQGPGHGKWRRGQRGGDPVARRIQMMDRRFNLTDEQKTQLQPVLQQSFQQAQAIRNDTSLTPEQKKEKLQQLRKTTHSQVQALLTPEQLERGKQAGAQNRVNFLSRKVNLTEAQKAQLLPIFQQQQQQMQSLRQDSTLSPEQKKDKARQIRQDTHKQVLAVLTPEQQQQLRSGVGGRRGHRGRGLGPGAGPQAPAGAQGSGQGAGPGI
jgi:Spy/CpxP family protein refolding chaperone